MRVDLYTDAGVKGHVATWATVAIVPGVGEPIEASGRLKAGTPCSATAELRAIANAVHRLIRLGDVRAGDEVRVLTDSRSAVDRIEGRVTKRPESSMAKATLVIRKLGEVHGIAISAAWVPGHKPDGHSPHARWNNRCDALCRAARQGKAKPPAKPIGIDDRPVSPADAAPLAQVRTKPQRALDVARRLAGGA